MSSQASQTLSPSPLCLSLVKFSYATVPNESIVPVPWMHIPGKNNLFAVFEIYLAQCDDGRPVERQILKVLRDPEVMEELDLNALSIEAHCALAQTPNVVNPQNPDVTILVQNPIIAIKYPMTNGQIRRFQIRLSSSEDFHEAMKMLSRANVPTTQAGTFPTRRPQTAPQPMPPNPHLLTPNDSASQLGVAADLPHTSDYGNNHFAVGASSALTRPVSAAQLSMAPPSYLTGARDSVQYRQLGHSSAFGHLQVGQTLSEQTSRPRSNVSLSTATTLVYDKRMPEIQETLTRTEAYGNPSASRGRLSPRLIDPRLHRQFNAAAVVEDDSGFALPPKRELPFRKTMSGTDEQTGSLSSSKVSLADGQKEVGKLRVPPEKAMDKSGPLNATTVKAKRPRAPRNASKKPRTPAPRKRAGGKSVRAERPVPVDEMPKQPENGLAGRVPSKRSITDTGEVEAEGTTRLGLSPSQRVPLSHKDGEIANRPLGYQTTRMTRSMSSASFAAQNARGNPEAPTREMPCTPAEQMIVPLTLDSPPAHQAVNKASLLRSVPAATPARSGRVNPTSSPLRASLLDHAETTPAAHEISSAESRLDADPHFANGLEKLASWSDLPDSTRLPALRSYFCRLVMDPNFVGLCKALDLFWEKELLARH